MSAAVGPAQAREIIDLGQVAIPEDVRGRIEGRKVRLILKDEADYKMFCMTLCNMVDQMETGDKTSVTSLPFRELRVRGQLLDSSDCIIETIFEIPYDQIKQIELIPEPKVEAKAEEPAKCGCTVS